MKQGDEANEKTPLLDAEKGLKVQAEAESGSTPRYKRVLRVVHHMLPGTWIGDLMHKYGYSPEFGEHVELSIRVAMVAMVFGAYMLDPNIGEKPYAITDGKAKKYVVPMVLFMLFYAIGKTVGGTIYNAWSIVVGTFQATLLIWIMYGFFPGGYMTTSPDFVFWFGVVVGCLEVVIMLYLNIDMNTRIYALGNFVWYWMAFLDGVENVNNQGFQITRQGTRWLAFLQCCFAAVAAILVSLLPYPIFAKQKARQIAITVSTDMCALWQDVTTHYWADHRPASYEYDKLLHDVKGLQAAVGAMKTNINEAWYECFGFGALERTRTYLTSLAAALDRDLDHIAAVLMALSKSQEEDISPEEITDHQRLAKLFLPLIQNIIEAATLLMTLSTEVSCRGGPDVAERAEIEKQVEVVKKAIDALRDAVVAKRLNTGTSEKKLDLEYLDEYTYFFCLSHFGRSAVQFGEALLGTEEEASQGLSKTLKKLVPMAVYDTSLLKDREHIRFVVRNSATILLAFFVGYVGFHGNMKVENPETMLLNTHSAGPAGILTLMLCKYLGSAMQSSLSRMMGTILGVVAGIMLVGVFSNSAHPTAYSWFPMLLTLGVWTALTMFMYLHGQTYAGTFLLMGVFGADSIVHCHCPYETRKTYTMTKIFHIMFALAAMIVVDVIMWTRPASEAATEKLISSWSGLVENVRSLFDKSPDTRNNSGALGAEIESCRLVGREASNEPRYWKAAWKGELFNKVINRSLNIRWSMVCMHYSAAMKGRNGFPKADFFRKLCEVEAFTEIGEKLLKRMEKLESLMPIFAHTTVHRFPELDNVEKLQGNDAEVEESIREFMRIANQKENSWMLTEVSDEGNHEFDTLENDPICKLSLILLCTMALTNDMQGMQRDILQEL